VIGDKILRLTERLDELVDSVIGHGEGSNQVPAKIVADELQHFRRRGCGLRHTRSYQSDLM